MPSQPPAVPTPNRLIAPGLLRSKAGKLKLLVGNPQGRDLLRVDTGWRSIPGEVGGGSFAGKSEIEHAVATLAFTAVAAPVARPDHDAATVRLFRAEVHLDVGDVVGATVGGLIGPRPEEQVPGLEHCEHSIAERCHAGLDLDQSARLLELL